MIYEKNTLFDVYYAMQDEVEEVLKLQYFMSHVSAFRYIKIFACILS